jgi:hypothetical protein
MNRYDEIKNLVSLSKKALNRTITEDYNHILGKHGLLTEAEVESEVDTEVETKVETSDDEKEDEKIVKSDKVRTFKISGGIISIHGKDKANLQLTYDEKTAFQETMDEFRQEVSELVDFNKLNLYEANVEWSGEIPELEMEFFFSVNESDGIYIKADMVQINQDYLEMIEKLKKYYEKFKERWSRIIASRKETSEIEK